ncbi:MAG: M48 family metalloprotease [Planctomycetota bacterium]|nr:M48 family metalloprotease [Planctomycetota bacterium]
MRHGLLLASLLCSAPLAAAPLFQETLDLEDIRRLVAELETVSPRNPGFIYPLDISIDPDPVINAGAGYYWFGEDKANKYAQLVVNQGLLDAPGCSLERLRAILAHEMAHLELGHALHESYEGDTLHAVTRQQELEADALGSRYLEQLGHDRAEMVDAILWLGTGEDHKAMPWITSVSGDHASPIMRAALLDPSDSRLAAVADYEHGLMYLECGQYLAAVPFFDLAVEKAPELREAYVMAARASLQNYYERLPLKVQEAWLRPNFGPMLTETHLLSGRSTKILDADRERHAEAMRRIAAIPVGDYGSMKMFLEGTAMVLHPDGDEDVIRAGGEKLRTLYQLPKLDLEPVELIRHRQRCANNQAIALQRLGRVGEARALLLEEMKSMQLQVPPMANNIGALPIADMSSEQMQLAAQFLEFYLTRVPPRSAGYERATDTFNALVERLGIPKIELESPEVVYLSAVEARVAGQEVGLFDSAKSLSELLGEPKFESRPIAKYQDLAKLSWGETGDVLALVERGRIVRLSTKRVGDAILLRSAYEEVQGQFEVRVGMT